MNFCVKTTVELSETVKLFLHDRTVRTADQITRLCAELPLERFCGQL